MHHPLESNFLVMAIQSLMFDLRIIYSIDNPDASKICSNALRLKAFFKAVMARVEPDLPTRFISKMVWRGSGVFWMRVTEDIL